MAQAPAGLYWTVDMTSTYLARRGAGGIFYFRRVLPAELRKKSIRTDLRISLRTNIHSTAIRIGRHLNAVADRVFDYVKENLAMLSTADVNEFMRSTLEKELSLFEEQRHEYKVSTIEEVTARADFLQQRAADWKADLICDDIEAVAQLVYSEATAQRLAVEPESDEFRRLCRAGLRALEQADLAIAERLRGNYDEEAPFRALGLTPQASNQVPAQHSVLPPEARRPLSEIYRECRAQKIDMVEWQPNTARAKDTSIGFFIDIVGDIRFDKISDDHINRFQAALCKAPALVGKGVYGGLTLSAAIKKYEELKAEVAEARASGQISKAEAEQRLQEPWARQMEKNTWNKHINSLSAVLKWAKKVRKWKIEADCKEYRLSRKARGKLPKKRKALPLDWLQGFLVSPMFTGHSPLRRSKPGAFVKKDGDYFSVLIAIFQGCRLDEGAKLKVEDITKEHGIWCLRLNCDESQSGGGKTGASYRKMPIHSMLVKLGLIKHFRKMRDKGEEYLFPEMSISKHHGTRSSNLSKRLLQYKRTIGIYEQWRDQHAFRHTINTQLTKKGVPEPIRNQLFGWVNEGMGNVDYLTASTVRELRDSLEKYDVGVELKEVNGEWQIAGATEARQKREKSKKSSKTLEKRALTTKSRHRVGKKNAPTVQGTAERVGHNVGGDG